MQVASILYVHTGVRCIYVNAMMFGGFDLVSNHHEQDVVLSKLISLEAEEPRILKTTTTVHSVQANVTRYLHQMYNELNKNKAMEEQIDRAAEQDLESRRWRMVSSWNCTLTAPLPDQVDHAAVCQQTALLSSPADPPAKFAGLNQTVWHLAKAAESRCSVASKDGGLHLVPWLRSEGDSPLIEPPVSLATPASGLHQDPLDALLVVLHKQTSETHEALLLLLRSLRAAGSTALVVIASADPKLLEPLVKDECGVELLAFDATLVRSQLAATTSFKPTIDLIAYVTLADFLSTEVRRFNQVLLVSADTYFQRDPFTAMPKRPGLMLFVDDPMVSNDAPTCLSGQLLINELSTFISLKVVMGSAQAVRDFLAISISIESEGL